MGAKKSKREEGGKAAAMVDAASSDLTGNLCELLRVGADSDEGRVRVDLASLDPGDTPGFDGGKKAGRKALAALSHDITDLQSRLMAHGYTGGNRRILVILQGLDTSGKGGAVKHAVGLLDPGGLTLTSFRAPTDEERRHDFLWRIRKELPGAGQIGIFDRSHYEDVLVARVHQLAPADEIERRYGAINTFEQRLVDSGTTILKCMLHISADEQRDRLLARLEDPTKVWKFRPEDVDERGHWPEYQAAYQTALERCGRAAPWYVIPSNHKWYRSLALAALLRTALAEMDLRWPEPAFDVEEQRSRLLAD
jgi:PPK2 family polyphosphate:nucleotide phosphotransferase